MKIYAGDYYYRIKIRNCHVFTSSLTTHGLENIKGGILLDKFIIILHYV